MHDNNTTHRGTLDSCDFCLGDATVAPAEACDAWERRDIAIPGSALTRWGIDILDIKKKLTYIKKKRKYNEEIDT